MKKLISIFLILISVNTYAGNNSTSFFYKGHSFELREFKKILLGTIDSRFRKNAELMIDDVILQSIRKDIDPILVMAMITQESSFNPVVQNARSGAFGPMQIMEGTIDDINNRLLKNTKNLSRYEYSQNIEAGVTYLQYLLKRFNNNPQKAVIAYNEGPGYILKLPVDFKHDHNYYNQVEKFYNKMVSGLISAKKNKHIVHRTIASMN